MSLRSVALLCAVAALTACAMRKSTKYAFRTWAAMLKRGTQRTMTGETMLTGGPDTGYFPDAYNVRSLTHVLYSVLPAEQVDPFADMELETD